MARIARIVEIGAVHHDRGHLHDVDALAGQRIPEVAGEGKPQPVPGYLVERDRCVVLQAGTCVVFERLPERPAHVPVVVAIPVPVDAEPAGAFQPSALYRMRR